MPVGFFLQLQFERALIFREGQEVLGEGVVMVTQCAGGMHMAKKKRETRRKRGRRPLVMFTVVLQSVHSSAGRGGGGAGGCWLIDRRL